MVKPKETMTEEPEESEESVSECPDRPSENPTLARCIRAWNRAYHKKLDEEETDFEAVEAGNRAYLRAMPPLAGDQNIRDFIACIAFASLTKLILQPTADHFLAAAKVALGTLRHQAKPADFVTRGPGRPRKTTATEENK